MLKKIALSFLFVILIVFMSGLVLEAFYMRKFFKTHMINGDNVIHVSGVIKQSKPLYLGKNWDNRNLYIKGYRKWIQVHDVTDAEVNVLKEGQLVDIETYKPHRLFITDEFSMSRRPALGIKVNNHVLRKSDEQKKQKLKNLTIFIWLSIFGLLMALAGAYISYLILFNSKKNITNELNQ